MLFTKIKISFQATFNLHFKPYKDCPNIIIVQYNLNTKTPIIYNLIFSKKNHTCLNLKCNKDLQTKGLKYHSSLLWDGMGREY